MNGQPPAAPKRVINIGEGDLNADWIKHIEFGLSNARELMAHAFLKYDWARQAGDAERMREGMAEYRRQAERELWAIEQCKKKMAAEDARAARAGLPPKPRDRSPEYYEPQAARTHRELLEGDLTALTALPAGSPATDFDEFDEFDEPDEFAGEDDEESPSDWLWGTPPGKAAPGFLNGDAAAEDEDEEEEEEDDWDEEGDWEEENAESDDAGMMDAGEEEDDDATGRGWNQARRDRLSRGEEEGAFAGPDQSFPIAGPSDVNDAWRLAGHADDPDAVRRAIIRIAREHGWTDALPASAQAFLDGKGDESSGKALPPGQTFRYGETDLGQIKAAKPLPDLFGDPFSDPEFDAQYGDSAAAPALPPAAPTWAAGGLLAPADEDQDEGEDELATEEMPTEGLDLSAGFEEVEPEDEEYTAPAGAIPLNDDDLTDQAVEMGDLENFPAIPLDDDGAGEDFAGSDTGAAAAAPAPALDQPLPLFYGETDLGDEADTETETPVEAGDDLMGPIELPGEGSAEEAVSEEDQGEDEEDVFPPI